MEMPPPGWYEDPVQGTLLRWGDGSQWTVPTAPPPQAHPPVVQPSPVQPAPVQQLLSAPALADVSDFAAAPDDDGKSLTEWLEDTPTQKPGTAVALAGSPGPGRHAGNSTQVPTGGRGASGTGALARLGRGGRPPGD